MLQAHAGVYLAFTLAMLAVMMMHIIYKINCTFFIITISHTRC